MGEGEAHLVVCGSIEHVAVFEARIVENEAAGSVFAAGSASVSHGDIIAAADAVGLCALCVAECFGVVAVGDGGGLIV